MNAQKLQNAPPLPGINQNPSSRRGPSTEINNINQKIWILEIWLRQNFICLLVFIFISATNCHWKRQASSFTGSSGRFSRNFTDILSFAALGFQNFSLFNRLLYLELLIQQQTIDFGLLLVHVLFYIILQNTSLHMDTSSTRNLYTIISSSRIWHLKAFTS